MPWSPLRQSQQQALRVIPVPPRLVVVDVPAAPSPPDARTEDAERGDGTDESKTAAEPPVTRPQVVEIPGYTITETTTGYLYPERWTLERVGPSEYRWRRLPAEFRPK
jgi:hypothetical protein